MIYLCSDWHFNHDRDFVWKARGFSSVNEMNEEIVKRHNSIVKEDDDIYVLGDLSMSANLEANKALIESLNGKIHIVLGNHDTDKRIDMYRTCKNVIEICGYSTVLKYKKHRFYLSHYPTMTANYSDMENPKDFTINICGHLHTKEKYLHMKQGMMSYHVEMDANNCYPTSIDKVVEDLHFMHHKCDCNGNCGENCKCKK